MNSERTQIISILFGDIAGYSRLNDDSLYMKVNRLIQDFFLRSLTAENHFFKKTWGDGILICSYDPSDLLEIALDLRDLFRNKNWKRAGFPTRLQIRIGIHAEKARLI